MKKLLIILLLPISIFSQYKDTKYSTIILDDHQEIIDSINYYLYQLVINYRIESGKSKLKIDKTEETSCLNHCNYMIEESNLQNLPGYFKHKEKNKSNLYYSGYDFLARDNKKTESGGENIAFYRLKPSTDITAYEIALTFFNGWKQSKIHNMNMLWDSHTTISSAVSIGNQTIYYHNNTNTMYLIYATQTFYK